MRDSFSPQEKEDIEKTWKMVVFVWVVFLGQLPLYGLLGALVLAPMIEPILEAQALQVMTLVFPALGACILGSTFFLRKIRTSQFAMQSSYTVPAILNHYRMTLFVCFAMVESIALLGIVLMMMTGATAYLLGMLGLCAMGFVIFRPVRAELMSCLERAR